MCGIIGVVGRAAPAAPVLIDGLKRLEYRGYDSAGIATVVDGHVERRRAEGKIANLEAVLADRPLPGATGIAHTRWATHGRPSAANAHPHADDRVAVVHNGIIENFRDLRCELAADGHDFATDTDTEAVVHLISAHLRRGAAPQEAVARTLDRLEGAFALAILFAGHDDLMIGARRGSPLAIGYAEGAAWLGSDALALAPLTRRICYLDEGDWAELRPGGAVVRDRAGAVVERPVTTSAGSGAMIGKGNHPHYMLKEIYEQPAAVGETLLAFLDPSQSRIVPPDLPFDLAGVRKVTIVACGTSYHAGLVARYWIERIARIPVEVDIASEFRYRDPVLPEDGLAVFVSQSGETADTLAALRSVRARGRRALSIVNVAESSMARESDAVLRTRAGPEIGVASTKAFTTQLATLACIAVALAARNEAVDREEEAALVHALAGVPAHLGAALRLDEAVAALAQEIAGAGGVLFLGRGTGYPIALEGALKLKETSYIHAEGYAAGEMKHGPIALIDERVPVVVIAPSDAVFEKMVSNVEEVRARGGRVIAFSDEAGARRLSEVAAAVALPGIHPLAAPIVYAVPVQLLAYRVAVLKGTDVDQPRNLAKSVTVE